MKFENTQVWGFEHAIRGMRNPKNSWSKSDSECLFHALPNYSYDDPKAEEYTKYLDDYNLNLKIGPNDMKLMQTLIKGGPEHRKFMRQIFVSVDITAPLYWYKEFDTYKVGTTANSTSTMHKITSAPITLDCFEIDDFNNVPFPAEAQRPEAASVCDHDFVQMCLIPYLEYLRQKYLETKDKVYWKELIRWLPESWLQTRTITMSYENVYNIVHQRINHKLNEWSGKDNVNLTNFIAWARSLPYANELIFIEEHNDQETHSENAIDALSKIDVNIKNTDGTFRSIAEILEDVANAYAKTSQASTDKDTSHKN